MIYIAWERLGRGIIPGLLKHAIIWRNKMDKYRCVVCGYVYDPADGDPDSGIEPNTPFEELPDDWVCPLCGAPKDQFEKE